MPGRKILIADDEPHVTFMVSMKLERAGAEVLVAVDGEEGLWLATQHKPDLIVTDYQMPRLSGFDMALKLRGTPETSDIPIIMLTARGHRLSPAELARTNIRTLLAKPFSAKELLRQISEFIKLPEQDGQKGSGGVISFSIKPQTANAHLAMQERCLALGLPVWHCNGDGVIVNQAQASESQRSWLRSSRLKSLIEKVAGAQKERGSEGPVALFAGCWLVVFREKLGLHCTKMAATLMLEAWALGTPEFLEICRAASMPAGDARKIVKSMIRPDREAVDQIAASLLWMHNDLQQLQVDRLTMEQFSNKLTQGYEQTNMLFRFGRMMNATDQPDQLMDKVCAELKQVLPFGWVAMKFKRDGAAATELAGTLVLKGAPACGADRLDSAAGDWLEAQPDHDWNRVHMPSSSPLAKLVNSEVIVAPIVHDDALIGMLLAGNKDEADPDVSSAELQMIDACADFLGVFHENLARYSEQHDLFMATVQALTSSIDAKDRYTCGHSERVALVASQLAVALGMNREQVEQVHIAGLLHDVGKIGVPESVLCKPAKLTTAEFELIKLHPQIGYDILKDIPMLQPMLPGVLHHHERWDGDGYPARLRGEHIPLMGRIIAVADAFDSMCSNRAYRPAMPRESVLDEIRRCSGTQFDPALASTFLSMNQSRYDQVLARQQQQTQRAA